MTDRTEVVQVITNHQVSDNCRILNQASEIHLLLQSPENPILDVVLRDWNSIADKLPNLGRSSVEVSLFHQGKHLPRWIMKICRNDGFCFEFSFFVIFTACLGLLFLAAVQLLSKKIIKKINKSHNTYLNEYQFKIYFVEVNCNFNF